MYKHVYAVSFSKELRRRIVSQVAQPTIRAAVIPESNVCDRCKSENSIVKDGLRHNKSGDVQTDRCKECNHKFIINTGFEKYRATPKVVTAALDLYFKGVSLRKICDHLRQFYSVKMTPRFSNKLNRLDIFVEAFERFKIIDEVTPVIDSLWKTSSGFFSIIFKPYQKKYPELERYNTLHSKIGKNF